MSQRFWRGLVLLALALAVVCGSVASFAQADSRGRSRGGAREPREARVEGTIRAVGAHSVTINGTVVPVSAATKIERNGMHMRLSSLRVGDRGQARIPAGANAASKVESVGP